MVPGPVPEPIHLPEETWRSSALIRMLTARDFRSLFNLTRMHGISVARIARSASLDENLVRQVMTGDAVITAAAQVERIADGLNLPVTARAALGVAPRADEPLHMPSEFWARPGMARALATWDVPAVLAAILDERGWTQHQLAAILGYSQSWVSNVLRRDQSLTLDQGRDIALKFGAPLDKLTLAPQGSSAGHVPHRLPTPGRAPGEELPATPGPRSFDPASGQPPAISELCAALTDYDLGQSGPAWRDGIPSAEFLERDLRVAFDSYQQSRFSTAAGRASILLADARSAAQACKDAERARVLRILALSYHVAAAVLSKAGQQDLAWIAAERGLNAAEATASPSVRGSLIRSVAFALLSTGRLEQAMNAVDSGAAYLRDENAAGDTVLSVYGTLLLVGALAAARFGDGPRTADYLREASSAAQRLGKDANNLWTAFGPTNVAIHRVNTSVELGDIQAVLDSGLSLNTDAVPAERRVRYLLDVARVHHLTGNRDDALGVMLMAERIAPEHVHQHYLAKDVVTALMRSTLGRPAVQLDKLARRMEILESL